MAKNVIIKMRKINSVKSNLSYLADTKEHPDLCYTYGTCMDKKVWNEYAQVNQKEFAASGAAKKGYRCVEAREAIYIFPQEYYNLPKQELERICRQIVDEFAKKHGVDVYAAMHGNDKECNNMHIHIMYMERTKEDRGCKIATRRIYFDDRGRQVKSRKFAIDEAGNLLPGYSYVKKGESYGGSREWSPKNQYLHSNQFTHAIKIDWANWLNKQRNLLQEPEIQVSEEREVYDPENSPYFPLQEEKKPFRYSDPEKDKESCRKAQELSQDIIECNELRIEYNECVDEAIEQGANKDELIAYRKGVSAKIIEAINDDEPGRIKDLFKESIIWIQNVLEALKKRTMEKLMEDKKKASLDDMIRSKSDRTGQKVRRKSGHDYGGR